MQREPINYKLGEAEKKTDIKNPFLSSALINKSEKIRVLVIDDEPQACKLLKAILNDNYDVFICGSVAEAEDVLQNYSCELIITDYKMPGKTGIDLARFVLLEKLSIPILMITGHGSVELSGQANKYGIKTILNKPYTPAELKSAIENVLGDL